MDKPTLRVVSFQIINPIQVYQHRFSLFGLLLNVLLDILIKTMCLVHVLCELFSDKNRMYWNRICNQLYWVNTKTKNSNRWIKDGCFINSNSTSHSVNSLKMLIVEKWVCTANSRSQNRGITIQFCIQEETNSKILKS